VPTYKDLLARQQAEVSDGLFAQAKRLRWSAARLASERDQRLRKLLSIAIDRSPFHAARLRGIDPATFAVSDLPSLPVLTKGEMMENFDDIVTDRDLSLKRAEDHLDVLASDNYLLDRYRVVSSGGSSGRRGIYVYGWDEWITLVLMERRGSVGQLSLSPPRIASLFSDKPAHISGALHAFAHDPSVPVLHLPMTTPLASIVAQLNTFQPTLIQGYPTALNLLVAEARAERLQIDPRIVRTSGELLTSATRRAVRELWETEIVDNWGASEGVHTSSCSAGAMHLPDDLVIIEAVDERGRPVAPGRRASKIYLTSLYNLTQPLIRYEITDSMVVEAGPCACGSAHSRITDLGGRLSDVFVYPNGATLHAAALEGPLFRDRRVIEYRIWQTTNGVEVALRTDGRADLMRIRDDLYDTLCHARLVDPDIAVRTADRLDRVWSGKLSRFVPLSAEAIDRNSLSSLSPI
jgi:phenylacetate-CoA ligase